MPESTQHKLDRIRPPRVQITYDVETRGSFIKKELPFVVGILADLSGSNPDLKTLRERKYVEIDRDNFNDIMKNIGPKCEVTTGDAKTTLAFQEIDDFSPIKVLRKLGVNTQYDKRTHLSDMANKLDGNVRLQKNLLEALQDSKKLEELKKSMADIKALLPKPEAAKQETGTAEAGKTEVAKPEESTEGSKDEGGKS